tara:strand:- start:6233 stop:6505 length:273 start_codon:yes stop_codon:yes gene_type:complete
MFKKIFFFFLVSTNVLKIKGLCVECGRCQYFYDGYKCKLFARSKKLGEVNIYNYKLLKENSTFKYLSIIEARTNEELCGKDAECFHSVYL